MHSSFDLIEGQGHQSSSPKDTATIVVPLPFSHHQQHQPQMMRDDQSPFTSMMLFFINTQPMGAATGEAASCPVTNVHKQPHKVTYSACHVQQHQPRAETNATRKWMPLPKFLLDAWTAQQHQLQLLNVICTKRDSLVARHAATKRRLVVVLQLKLRHAVDVVEG